MKKLKLAIIFGGQSSEYPVSLHSVGSLIHNLDMERYEPLYVGITQTGKWYYYGGDVEAIEHDHWQEHESVCAMILSPSAGDGFLKVLADGTLERVQVDCIFPVLHGKNGEDGTIQGLFELSGIPYVGCGHMASALIMDKEMTHIIAEANGIPCAPYLCVRKSSGLDLKKVYEEAKEKLGLPIFMKPANAGSSFGIHKASTFVEFVSGMEDAMKHDGRGKVILEKTIEGFEIGTAVMGNDPDDLIIGSVDEIETSAPFFDYEGKYNMVDSAIYCPARISKELSEQAKQLALATYRALNCRGLTRIDLFVTKDEQIILNEANTIPGFTATSRYPSMMKDIGISFTDLLNRLIAYAMEK